MIGLIRKFIVKLIESGKYNNNIEFLWVLVRSILKEKKDVEIEWMSIVELILFVGINVYR